MSLIGNPPHPGEVLEELYMVPLGLSAGSLADALDVPRTRIERVVRGQTALSVDTALRLARYFGTSAEVWTGMQTAYDLRRIEREKEETLARIVPMPKDASASASF